MSKYLPVRGCFWLCGNYLHRAFSGIVFLFGTVFAVWSCRQWLPSGRLADITLFSHDAMHFSMVSQLFSVLLQQWWWWWWWLNAPLTDSAVPFEQNGQQLVLTVVVVTKWLNGDDLRHTGVENWETADNCSGGTIRDSGSYSKCFVLALLFHPPPFLLPSDRPPLTGDSININVTVY